MKSIAYTFLLFLFVSFGIFPGCHPSSNNTTILDPEESKPVKYIWANSSGIIGVVRESGEISDPTTFTYCFSNPEVEIFEFKNGVLSKLKSFKLTSSEGEAFCLPSFFIRNSNAVAFNLFSVREDQGHYFKAYLKTYLLEITKGTEAYTFSTSPKEGVFVNNLYIFPEYPDSILVGSTLSSSSSNQDGGVSWMGEYLCNGAIYSYDYPLDVSSEGTYNSYFPLVKDQDISYLMENRYYPNEATSSRVEIFSLSTQVNGCRYSLANYQKVLTYGGDGKGVFVRFGKLFGEDLFLLADLFSVEDGKLVSHLEVLKVDLKSHDVFEMKIPDEEFYSFQFSQDGKLLALWLGEKIYVVDLEGLQIAVAYNLPEGVDLSSSAKFSLGSSLFFDTSNFLYIVGKENDKVIKVVRIE